MRENRLRWYEHVFKRPMNVVLRRGKMINVSDTRKDRGISRKTLIEVINKDLSMLKLTKYMTFYKSQWR